ncbi:hypothetical protein BCR34DRAFT_584975 [Clohesyomyces aquaticus]|uniref:Uncharacterized protein n=1 Tax=Clohesyomyces aquaticus TaxID=1231657 RepID=A0A1Y1ZZ74_9PLEO|nr:hypothetical protein BCR34DRAFT_584975 [Clohesyomyces aquaticus]
MELQSGACPWVSSSCFLLSALVFAKEKERKTTTSGSPQPCRQMLLYGGTGVAQCAQACASASRTVLSSFDERLYFYPQIIVVEHDTLDDARPDHLPNSNAPSGFLQIANLAAQLHSPKSPCRNTNAAMMQQVSPTPPSHIRRDQIRYRYSPFHAQERRLEFARAQKSAVRGGLR